MKLAWTSLQGSDTSATGGSVPPWPPLEELNTATPTAAPGRGCAVFLVDAPASPLPSFCLFVLKEPGLQPNCSTVLTLPRVRSTAGTSPMSLDPAGAVSNSFRRSYLRAPTPDSSWNGANDPVGSPPMMGEGEVTIPANRRHAFSHYGYCAGDLTWPATFKS